MKKRAKFAVLGLCTGIYLTVGGFGLYVYYIFLAMKITHRKYLLETEEFLTESPPYPLVFHMGFIILLVAYLVLGCFLVYKCLNQLRFVNYPLMSLGLLVILAFCGHFVAKEGIIFWNATPPMSKQKAISLAIEKNESTSSHLFKSIHWDKANYYWIIIFTNTENTICEQVTISRLGVISEIIPCKE